MSQEELREIGIRFLQSGFIKLQVPKKFNIEQIQTFAMDTMEKMSDDEIIKATWDYSSPVQGHVYDEAPLIEAIEDVENDFELLYSTPLWEAYAFLEDSATKPLILKMIFGESRDEVKILEFETQQEVNAYLKGIADMDGWQAWDYEFLQEGHNKNETFEYFWVDPSFHNGEEHTSRLCNIDTTALEDDIKFYTPKEINLLRAHGINGFSVWADKNKLLKAIPCLKEEDINEYTFHDLKLPTFIDIESIDEISNNLGSYLDDTVFIIDNGTEVSKLELWKAFPEYGIFMNVDANGELWHAPMYKDGSMDIDNMNKVDSSVDEFKAPDGDEERFIETINKFFGTNFTKAGFGTQTYALKYRCERCNEEWVDSWNSEVDNDCPICNTTISPYSCEPVN